MRIANQKFLTPRRAIGACAVATVAVSLTACGDTVTAARDWYSIASHVGSRTIVGGQPFLVMDYAGQLETDIYHGSVVPGSRFQEHCSRPDVTGASWTCQAIVNTGQRVYVAAGTTSSDLNHTLPVQAGSHGTFTMKLIGGGTLSMAVKLSLRP
jgi:hypothetical protein